MSVTIRSLLDAVKQTETKERFKFMTLPHFSGTVANVFIHGYSAGHDMADRRALTGSIPSSLNGCINIFAFWSSGHIAQVDHRSKQAILALMRANLYVGAAAIAAERAAHFYRKRSLATKMGSVLLQQLEEYLLEHHPYVTTVNFVGHSLGGRILVSALKTLASQPEQDSLQVGDVLLMATAAELKEDEAQAISARIEGRLINAYSETDKVLLMNVGETCLGRNEVAHCVNLNMAGFGHKDYWPRLGHVLAASQFHGYNGEQEAGPDQPIARQKFDPVTADTLLFEVMKLTHPNIRDQTIKHLKSSRWVSFDEKRPVYSLTRELQLLAGHCLANLARGRGMTYVDILAKLAEHSGLDLDLHGCVRVIDLEALLVSQFFKNSFTGSHPLAHSEQIIQRVQAMSAQQYFDEVDGLANSLTLGSVLKSSSATIPVPVPRKKNRASIIRKSSASSLLDALSHWLPTQPLSTSLTNFMSSMKPGYSALIPALALVFFARLEVDKESLM